MVCLPICDPLTASLYYVLSIEGDIIEEWLAQLVELLLSRYLPY